MLVPGDRGRRSGTEVVMGATTAEELDGSVLAPAEGEGAGETDAALNQVVLRGRVSGAPVERELPSGTTVVGVRISVRRGRTTMTRGSKQTVDWLECTAWSAGTRRTISRWEVGDVVEVEGALRRRFPRGGGTSRVEVEVLRGRRLARG
jgi:single-strand DNA-binding protein